MIRIIAGEFRGRKLKVPTGNDVRPTSDKVREALFNLLTSMLNWDNMTVLDLYAGSGALGLEALSRGAKKAIFVESSKKHVSIILKNISMLSLEQTKYELVRGRGRVGFPILRIQNGHALFFLIHLFQVTNMISSWKN